MATNIAEYRSKELATSRIRRDAARLLETLLLLIIIAFIMLPIFWLAMTSFKPPEKTYTTDVIFPPTLKNYEIIFADGSVLVNEGTDRERGEIGRNMVPNVINSVVVSGRDRVDRHPVWQLSRPMLSAVITFLAIAPC